MKGWGWISFLFYNVKWVGSAFRHWHKFNMNMNHWVVFLPLFPLRLPLAASPCGCGETRGKQRVDFNAFDCAEHLSFPFTLRIYEFKPARGGGRRFRGKEETVRNSKTSLQTSNLPSNLPETLSKLLSTKGNKRNHSDGSWRTNNPCVRGALPLLSTTRIKLTLSKPSFPNKRYRERKGRRGSVQGPFPLLRSSPLFPFLPTSAIARVALISHFVSLSSFGITKLYLEYHYWGEILWLQGTVTISTSAPQLKSNSYPYPSTFPSNTLKTLSYHSIELQTI